MNTAPSAALVLDVDGVLSPLHGHTTWGDDQIAGDLFGPVHLSPALVLRLEAITGQPHVLAAWLTDWPARWRTRMRGFPGRDWPDIGEAHRKSLPRSPGTWWKPLALREWLHDDLSFPRTSTTDQTDLDLIPLLGEAALAGRRLFGTTSTHAEVHLAHLSTLLIAPDPATGLTEPEVARLERFLGHAAVDET